VSLKAKWERLHFNSAETCLWVFVAGRMYVINEAACAKKMITLNKKTGFDLKIKTREKERIL
jgi:hypothetical protein